MPHCMNDNEKGGGRTREYFTYTFILCCCGAAASAAAAAFNRSWEQVLGGCVHVAVVDGEENNYGGRLIEWLIPHEKREKKYKKIKREVCSFHGESK